MLKQQQILPWLLCSTQRLWTIRVCGHTEDNREAGEVHAPTQPFTILKHKHRGPPCQLNQLSLCQSENLRHQNTGLKNGQMHQFTHVYATAATTVVEAP